MFINNTENLFDNTKIINNHLDEIFKYLANLHGLIVSLFNVSRNSIYLESSSLLIIVGINLFFRKSW